MRTSTHTHIHLFRYQANDAHKSLRVHIITVDFPLRSHNCSGASRTVVKGFMRCSPWRPVTPAGRKFYCSWWDRDGEGEQELIAQTSRTSPDQEKEFIGPNHETKIEMALRASYYKIIPFMGYLIAHASHSMAGDKRVFPRQFCLPIVEHISTRPKWMN